jgi:hypothetical protein
LDAIATLAPDALTKIADDWMRRVNDLTLLDVTEQAEQDWQANAVAEFDEHADHDALAAIERELSSLGVRTGVLERNRVEAVAGVVLPEWDPPDGEAPDLGGVTVADSDMEWAEATRALIADGVRKTKTKRKKKK